MIHMSLTLDGTRLLPALVQTESPTTILRFKFYGSPVEVTVRRLFEDSHADLPDDGGPVTLDDAAEIFVGLARKVIADQVGIEGGEG